MTPGYGLPLECQQQDTRYLQRGLVRGTWLLRGSRSEFSMLKTPGERAVPCPHCGARLVARRHREA